MDKDIQSLNFEITGLKKRSQTLQDKVVLIKREMEIFDYGELDCDIYFCNSMRTYIPMSSGISEIGKTLQLTFGFEFQGWLRKKVRDALKGSDNTVSLKLRDRVLKEGKVLPNDIIDVSAFMDSMVDVNLMDECAGELANRFEFTKPTKILTIATTGKCARSC